MQDSTYPMPPPPPPPANPYAPPTVPYASGLDGSQAEAERIRAELGQHEAEIKTLGTLYLIGAGVAGLAAVGLLIAVLLGRLTTPDAGVWPWIGVVVVVVLGSLLYYWVGSGLRRLERAPRVGAIVLSGLGVLGFPLGTVIHGYFLYLLASERGSRIFTPEYQLVLAATPHMKFKSTWMMGCLIILVALGAIVAVTILMAGWT